MVEFDDGKSRRRGPFIAVAIVVVVLPLVFAWTRQPEPVVPPPTGEVRELLRASGRGTTTFTVNAPAGSTAIAVTIACLSGELAVSTSRAVAAPCGSGKPNRLVLPARPGRNALTVRADGGTRFALAVVPTSDAPDAPLPADLS